MTVFTLKSAVALLVCASVVACAPTPNLSKRAAQPGLRSTTTDANQFAISVLDSLQARSIAESREYCGLILRAPDGGLVTSAIFAGAEDNCSMPSVIGDVVATFHTHGSYGPEYDNEVPSVSDVMGDLSQRVDGYVATPGGRVWHIDYETRRINLLCGPLCITSDPNDVPKDAGFVPASFTLPQLRARFGQPTKGPS